MQFVMQPGMVTNTRSGGSRRYWSASQLSAQCSSNWPSIKCLSIELRRRHNGVATAIFSVVGVTFAVLLAFVAMLAWEDFNKAKAAAYAEAATVLDVFNASVGLAGPETSQMREAIVGYLEIVARCMPRLGTPRKEPKAIVSAPPTIVTIQTTAGMVVSAASNLWCLASDSRARDCSNCACKLPSVTPDGLRPVADVFSFSR